MDAFEGREAVLYLAPQASTALDSLHVAVHESARGIGTSAEHTRPGAWVPHATVAMALHNRALAVAQLALAERFSPFVARVTALAVVQFRPGQIEPATTLYHEPLGQEATAQ